MNEAKIKVNGSDIVRYGTVPGTDTSPNFKKFVDALVHPTSTSTGYITYKSSRYDPYISRKGSGKGNLGICTAHNSEI